METPICVIDAKTLVDIIQDLKKWIYSGQLRLVVPSCTIEQVEQLYEKSLEPKPTTQEAPRSRPLGKPPKKEYPAFDINPRVAREYLGRLKSRKEQDAESEQRLFFQEMENHEAVCFQEPNEQYTPWKDLDVEEEKPEAIKGPPTSWAEALRRKQILANGTSEKPMSKAPTKPKLVARAAGSETSPWKVKKDAPKISAKDVPGALRPLMSCALWRLHESIERNDANQLFLLSNQTETRSVAQKLNIIARSPKEVAATIASKTSRTDLDTSGDLEQEFGIQQKSATVASKDAEVASGENGVSESPNEDLSKDEDAMNNSVTSEETANTDASSIVHEQDLDKQSLEQETNPSTNGKYGENEVEDPNGLLESATTLLAEDVSKKSAKSVESIKSLVNSITWREDEKLRSESVHNLSLNGDQSQGQSNGEAVLNVFEKHLPPSPQPHAIETPQPVQQLQTTDDRTRSPPKEEPIHALSTPEAKQEPEDSDEEVVVFKPQPKRFSAQKKPVQQESRPSTPKDQPQQKPADRSPQPLVRAQQKGKPARHSPKSSIVGRSHSQSTNSPTVIDPDAFGRDFRINLNPSPRPPQNLNGHVNNRPRAPMHSAQTGQASRNSPRQHTRTSPPRNTPQDGSERLAPAPQRTYNDGPHHRRQNSHTSPRRAKASRIEDVSLAATETGISGQAVQSNSQFPKVEAVDFTEPVPKTALPEVQSSSSAPQSRVYEPTEFVPRSAMPETQLKPKATQTKVYDHAEFIPRPAKPIPQPKPRAPRPKVFEPAEFVPRDFVPRPTTQGPYKPQIPEPEYIEPRPSINDVDYVLKSGSTRASARGRGRLWTPS